MSFLICNANNYTYICLNKNIKIMKATLDYQSARIEALEKMIAIQQDLIDEKTKTIDEITFKYADAKARLNMLVRNIEVVDAIFEQPIKN